MLGSLFPDLDSPNSTLGKFNIFARFMRHRGSTHTLLGLFLTSLFIFLLAKDTNAAFNFAFGYFTHLLLDTLTPQGIMWYYPVSKHYVRIPKHFRLF